MINILKEIHQHNLQITINRKSANNDVYYDYIEIIITRPDPHTMIKGTIAFYCYSNDILVEVLQDLIYKLLKEEDVEFLDKKRTDLVNKYIEEVYKARYKKEGD